MALSYLAWPPTSTFSLLTHLTFSPSTRPHLLSLPSTFSLSLSLSLSSTMSCRPNYPRRPSRRRWSPPWRGRWCRGGGEQRWWDPVWRAQRLAQKAAEYEVMDENEWWNKLEGFKKGAEQEMIIRRCFRRDDREILSDMAYHLTLHLKDRREYLLCCLNKEAMAA